MGDDDAFFAAARAAAVRYVREIALFPSFPALQPVPGVVIDGQETETLVAPVLRVVATSKFEGEVLPRTDDTWLAIRAFHDIAKSTLPAWATALVERRMAAITLLVRLSASPQFGWSATMDCSGQRVKSDSQSSFWIDLLRDLNPDAPYDRLMSLERNLVALSRSPSPRFLFCVDSDPSQSDMGELLDQILWSDTTNVVEGTDGKNVYDDVLDACGLTTEPISPRTIDIGLSFTTGKITHALMTKIFDVQNRLQSNERRADGIRFRLTTVRIGSSCAVQPKALEAIQERWRPDLEFTSFSLGSIGNVKPAAVQDCLVRLVNEPSSKLRCLEVFAGDAFPAVASVFRASSASSIDEVDVLFHPTEEFAAWLAFTFFHVDTNSKVSSLCLRTFQDRSLFNDEWIEAFERALQSCTASEDLTGEEVDKDEDGNRTFVTVKAATPVKSHPYSGAKLLCKLGSDPDGNDLAFERITHVKKLVGVSIPGIGIGWVPEASVVATRSEPSALRTDHAVRTSRRVTSLSIGSACMQKEETTMLRLLSVIGEPLESLSLPKCWLETDHLAELLRFCPNLKELNISGHHMTDIGPLVDAYTANRCRIASLSLTNPTVLSGDDLIPEQLTALLRAIAYLPLRRLRMHLLPQRRLRPAAPHCTPEVAEALAVALSEYHQLEFVQLTTLTGFGVGALLPLDPLPLDFSVGASGVPLALDCKLAFLSVVRKERGACWSRLDADMLSRIFSFSRNAVVRHVLRCP